MSNLQKLMEKHNSLVKVGYTCASITNFKSWLHADANFDEGYIEISSNETISGHAEILEIEGIRQ